MVEPVYLSVITPAYLEEENLRILLPRIKNVLSQLSFGSEIIVIDSQKKLDCTDSACQENQVRYFRREGGENFGDAVRTGIRVARGKYMLFMDADGSHPPEFIRELVAHHLENDIVIASRYVSGGLTENPVHLIWMSQALNITYGLILGIKVNDISNSFKLYRSDLLKNLNLSCKNFDIIEEILFKISRANPNLKIKEVPFSFKKRMFGETKRNLVLFVITFIFTIFKLRFSKQKNQ